jgi:hypothetical protein
MKLHLLIGAVALAMVGAEAMAQCANSTRVGNLQNLLPGNTVCATRGADKWQEQHRLGGQLWDYKRGAGDLIDPTRQVGTWSIGGPANREVTYSYTNGPSFTFTVHEAGGSLYNFCSGSAASITAATILTGSVACP